MADDSKTEKATPKKRRDERKRGHIAMSNDVVTVASLLGSIMMLRFTLPGAAERVGEFMAFCLRTGGKGVVLPREMIFQCIALTARIAGPFLAAAILLSVIATMAQTQMLVTTEPLKPKFSKLNPISGFQRLFSLHSLVEALKNILKVMILLYFIYRSLRTMMGVTERYLYADLGGACSHLFDSIIAMLIRIAAAFLVISAVDFFYQHWDFERQMRMSKEEIKEEYKQTEGNPQIKGRIKELQRRMARQRMMQQVPRSDVVVRNPTHVAVALRYHPEEDAAPIVLAMGQDSLAARIVAVAEEHGILVMEDPPLARALYAEGELNRPIPQDLYEAVAEVMVYLYRLGRIHTSMEEPIEES